MAFILSVHFMLQRLIIIIIIINVDVRVSLCAPQLILQILKLMTI